MRQDATVAFEDFIERKWLDALNIAATEPTPWRGDGEKVAWGGALARQGQREREGGDEVDWSS
jgi:hypothetical protein